MASGRVNAIVNSLGPSERAELAAMMRQGDRSITDDAYYSTVRFGLTISGTAATLAAKVLKPFSYKIGDTFTAATHGFTTGSAHKGHTNLLKPGNTNNAQQMRIMGVSIAPESDSDAFLLMQLWKHLTLKLKLQKVEIDLGPVMFIPASGGLSGTGLSKLVLPTFDQTEFSVLGYGTPSNGIPGLANYKPLSTPLDWNPDGKDSQLACELELQQAIALTLPVTRAAGSGIAQYTAPATNDFGTYVDVKVVLHGPQIGERGEAA